MNTQEQTKTLSLNGNFGRAICGLGLVLAFFTGRPETNAQIVSNIGSSITGSTHVGSIFGILVYAANAFTTGSNAGGYTLESATLQWAAVNNTPTNVELQIYTESAGTPDTPIGTLTGPSPIALQRLTYSTAGISLDANTTYFLVAQNEGENATGLWARSTTLTETSTDGWTIADQSLVSEHNSTSWREPNGSDQAHIFSLQATPVPEPSEYALMVGLGLIGFSVWRKRTAAKELEAVSAAAL